MPKFASGHSLPTPTPVRELGWTTALFGADHSTVYLHTWNQVTVVSLQTHTSPGWSLARQQIALLMGVGRSKHRFAELCKETTSV